MTANRPAPSFRPVLSLTALLFFGVAFVGPTAPAFVGTTAIPLAVIAAARAALRMLRLGRVPVRRFQANARLLHESLPGRPEIRGDPRTPATAVYPSSTPQAAALRRALLAAGILPSWIRYPTGPATGFFRFAVSGAQVRRLAAAIRAGLTDSP